ncbi:MAG TPA: ribonuclease III [Afifellaceae bacterium]|nr:ribonuclease III [Afifellaceae bacterium]
MAAKGDPAGFEKTLGYTFRDPGLLKRALTHASAVAERGNHDPAATYQRLEFLGDRVLGLVVADMLIAAYPDAVEGELARRLARPVSRETCAEVAMDMGLDAFVRLGGSLARKRSGNASGVLSDVCESVIGALYRDGGLAAARPVIERYWRERMTAMSGPLRDAKTELQEWTHRKGLSTPDYHELSRSGPDHAPVFEIEVIIDSHKNAVGSGKSKREAEQAAAEAVLRREGIWSQT